MSFNERNMREYKATAANSRSGCYRNMETYGSSYLPPRSIIAPYPTTETPPTAYMTKWQPRNVENKMIMSKQY